jgi:hypothetical protein
VDYFYSKDVIEGFVGAVLQEPWRRSKLTPELSKGDFEDFFRELWTVCHHRPMNRPIFIKTAKILIAIIEK